MKWHDVPDASGRIANHLAVSIHPLDIVRLRIIVRGRRRGGTDTKDICPLLDLLVIIDIVHDRIGRSVPNSHLWAPSRVTRLSTSHEITLSIGIRLVPYEGAELTHFEAATVATLPWTQPVSVLVGKQANGTPL